MSAERMLDLCDEILRTLDMIEQAGKALDIECKALLRELNDMAPGVVLPSRSPSANDAIPGASSSKVQS